MSKKAIGSFFTILALVFALLKGYVWVMVGLLVAAIVFNCDSKYIKRISQCLLLLLSVLAVMQLISLIFGGFASTTIGFAGASDYDNFYYEMTKWLGLITNLYLIVFVILGAVAFCADKEMPLYGQLVDKIYGAVSKTGASSGTFSGAASAGTEQNSGTDEK